MTINLTDKLDVPISAVRFANILLDKHYINAY